MSDVISEIRSAQKTQPFLQYLLNTTLDPALHQPCLKHVLLFQQSDRCAFAFRRLSTEGFLAAPVLDGTRYVGWISMLDIVIYITNICFGLSEDDWDAFLDRNDQFQSVSVSDVMSTRGATDPLYTSNSTFHALESLAMSSAHRLAVLNNRLSRRVVNIFTQSMLISEIRQRLHLLGDLRHRQVSSMVNWFQTVSKINQNSAAVNAFKRIANENIGGLAVVDDDGILRGSISTRDLRGIGTDGALISRLFLPIQSFKVLENLQFKELAPRSHYSVGPPPKVKPIYVTRNQTFEDVIIAMKDGLIHRVFVCGEDGARRGQPIPEKVITQTDVLSIVHKHYTVPGFFNRLL